MEFDISRMPDGELIGIVAKGGELAERAFREIYRRYADGLFNYLRSMGVRQEDARDLLQNIFFRVYKSASKFDQNRSFAPYVYRVARNVAYTFFKRNPYSREVSLDNSPAIMSWKIYVNRDDVLALRRAFSKLSDELRTILFLRYYLDFSQKEIAEAMELSPRQVSLRLQKAERLMKVLLKDEV